MLGAWEKLAWTLVMPALAECVASVWLEDDWFMLRTHDVKLVFLNASGALLEGLFSAWEGGRALPPRGTLGKVLLSLADPMRGGFIAAYTSWAGMVSFAATQGESFVGCLIYLAVTSVVGLLAYGVGGAMMVSTSRPGWPAHFWLTAIASAFVMISSTGFSLASLSSRPKMMR